MVHRANASHIGSCLSAADILAHLYAEFLRVDPRRPDWEDRDRFILSKGHAAAALYAVLAEVGFFPTELLDTYCQNGSELAGHSSHDVSGVEVSTGALGHGLSIGCGMALAGIREGLPYRVCVLLSDGECDEGSIWEAALFASHHRLDNLIALVDHNKFQALGAIKEVLNLQPFAEKWRAFNWEAREIDGHDHGQIKEALCDLPFRPGKPSVIIAHTVKGKGVSYMENNLAWHYKSPDTDQLKLALAELEKDL
jgi:transketolase